MFQNLSKQPFKIYNGTNHTITLYSANDFTVNRKGQHFLLNRYAQPNQMIPQEHPLSVRNNSTLPITQLGIHLFLPAALTATLDILPGNPADYDCIVISNLYGQLLIQRYWSNPNLLDRLFVPIPLYDCDPQTNTTARKIGSVGLQKVWGVPIAPQTYMQELQAGRTPSRAAIQICVETQSQYPYHDFDTSTSLQFLRTWLYGPSTT